MTLDDALFLVQRGVTKCRCKGSDLKSKLQVGDKLLVQRNNQRFHTWYGKPSHRDKAYYTRRVRFNNQCFPNDAGDINQHTDQSGEVNLSYWWGCGGPSPIREFRNIRNKNVSGFVDLDGQAFPLQNNPDVLLGSICRITSDAGWSSWHEIEFNGGSNGLGFKTQYTNDANRERTDLKVEGVENTYKPVNGEILTFDFFNPAATSDSFPDIQDDDLLLAWDGTKNRHVTGTNFKTLLIPQPPPGSVAVGITYTNPNLSGDSQLSGVDAFYWINSDGKYIKDETKTGDVILNQSEVVNYVGFAYWAEDPSAFGFLPAGSDFRVDTLEITSWTNTTSLTDSSKFGYRAKASVSLSGLENLDTTNWNSLAYLFTITSAKRIDWSGAVNWNTSNVTSLRYLFKGGGTNSDIADLSHLDWTSVEDANSLFSAPYDGIPRWIEKIQWGPGLSDLVNVAGGTVLAEDTDLCGDGQGDLDLRGWCVSGISSKPDRFFYYDPSDVHSIFSTVKQPLWGECPITIEDFPFPTDKVVLDFRVIDKLDIGE